MFAPNRTLGFLRRNLLSCPQDVKEMAYKWGEGGGEGEGRGGEWGGKALVRPILEYASPVWDPHEIVVQEELEKVQNLEARFVTGNWKYDLHSSTVRVGVSFQEMQR